jgi:hypothetical protein
MVGMSPLAKAPERSSEPRGAFEPDFRSKKTIVGMPPVTPANVGGSGESARPTPMASGQRTMIGVPVPSQVPANDDSGQAAGQRNNSSRPPALKKTALGLAIPGVAPLAPGVARPDASAAGPQAGGMAYAPSAFRDGRGARSSDRPHAYPAPSYSAPPPSRRSSTASRSAAIAVIGGLLLAVGAALFALLWRSPPSLRAEARVDVNGNDLLHISCSSCPDGTELRSAGAQAKVVRETADLQLSTPLRVGDNQFDVDIDRPANGRDERVALVVKIGYRIRPDLSMLDSDHPALRVAIDGLSGAVVTIDGKSLVLGPDGKGVYDLDVTKDCTGLSDEPKTIDRAVTYAVTSGSGNVENGTINLHVAIPPLHVDSPAEHAYLASEWFMLAGRTAKGARLMAGGQVVGVAADGSFSRSMQATRLGPSSIALRSYVPGQASRLATLEIERVERLASVAPAFAAKAPLTFTDLSAAIDRHIGEPIVLVGEVMEGRTQGSRGLLVLDVQRGCSRPPCLARVVLPGQDAPARGERIQVYGRVKGAVASSVVGASPVPEVEAAFMLKGP